jgi:periplasmic protein TonB
MTDLAAIPDYVAAEAPTKSELPSVKPRWLGPVATVAVVLAHVSVAALLMHAAVEKYVPLESVSMDLIPEGDLFESQQQEAQDDTPPPEEIEQPDVGLPPPMVMTPDAPPLPAKKEVVEPKKRVVEHKPTAAPAQEKRQAQERHHLGMTGGRAQSGGVSRAAYGAMLAAAIRRHTPSDSELGQGSASCTFHVTAGGGMSGISCSGSSSAHASLARRAIASTHAPPPPGGGFFASQSLNFR